MITFALADFKAFVQIELNFKKFLITSIAGLSLKHFLRKILTYNSSLMESHWFSNCVFLFILTTMYFNTQLIKESWNNLTKISSIIKSSKINIFFIFCLMFHTISFGSSSFIEEEHQTWYYLGCSFLIILCVMEIRNMNLIDQKGDWNLIGTKFPDFVEKLHSWSFVFIAHCFVRRLNQTGNKWIQISDVSDWLMDNKFWMSFLLFFGEFFFYSILTK